MDDELGMGAHRLISGDCSASLCVRCVESCRRAYLAGEIDDDLTTDRPDQRMANGLFRRGEVAIAESCQLSALLRDLLGQSVIQEDALIFDVARVIDESDGAAEDQLAVRCWRIAHEPRAAAIVELQRRAGDGCSWQ